MSIVIIGGHDRMVSQYKKICKSHKCKAKVFTQMPADLARQIGCPTRWCAAHWMKQREKASRLCAVTPAAAVLWKGSFSSMQSEPGIHKRQSSLQESFLKGDCLFVVNLYCQNLLLL